MQEVSFLAYGQYILFTRDPVYSQTTDTVTCATANGDRRVTVRKTVESSFMVATGN